MAHSAVWGVWRGRGAWRLVRAVGVMALVVAALVGAAAGALMVRLEQGPIAIDGLGQRVAAAMSERSGLTIAFGATNISRTERGATIVVDRLTASADGKTVVSAPQATVSLDPLSLLRLDPRPRYIDALDLQITLLALPDGAFALTAGGEGAAPVALSPAAPPPPADPPAALGAPPRSRALLTQAAAAAIRLIDFATGDASVLGGVRHIGVKRGKLIVDDRALDRTITFADVEIVLEKAARSAAFAIKATGPNGPVSAHAVARADQHAQRTLDAAAHGVTIDDVNLALGAPHSFVDSDSKVDLTGRFALDSAGVVQEARARFFVNKGFLRFADPDHEPLFYDEIAGGVAWNPHERRVTIEPIHFFSGGTRLTFAGAIEPPASDQAWRITLGLAEPGVLAPDRPHESAVSIAKGVVEATLSPQDRQVTLQRIEAAGPDFALTGAGRINWADGPQLALELAVERAQARTLLRLWPNTAAAKPRGWLIHHLRAGTASGRLAINFDKTDFYAMKRDLPPRDEALTIDYTVVGGVLTPLQGLPDLTGIDGAGRTTGRSSVFTAQSATQEFGRGQKLHIANATFSMPANNGERATPARLEMRVQGAIDTVAELLAKETIKKHASLPVEPGVLKGHVDGKLRLDFKIGPDAQEGDLAVNVTATVANFVIEKLVGKERFESPAFTVIGDPKGLQASGAGRMLGAPASLDLRKGVGQPAIAALTLTLDDSARAKLGFSANGVAGPIEARMNATLTDGPMKANVEIDLSRVALDNPLPGVVKQAGRPGGAKFVLTQRDNAIKIDDLSFEAGSVAARGAIDLTGAGAFSAARLTHVRLSAGDDMRVDAQRSGDGVKIVARGGSIDARPFLKTFTRAGDAGGKDGDFDLDFKSPIVSGYGKHVLSNVDFKMTRRGGALRALALTGAFGREPIAVGMARADGGQPQINVTAGDAGALLSFTDLYGRMESGALSATLLPQGATLNGTVAIRNFYLRNEPAIRRLVTEGVARVNAAGERRIDPGLVKFDRMQASFSRTGARLDLRESMLSGAEIGLTVEGAIDEARHTMALSGTFVPAFAINNFFSKIPVVGMLLTGGWNEGLIAINFKLNGAVNAPQLSVNPLSAVTPGFLRKLFGALDAGAQPAQPASPAGR